jgi:glycosyltransferase involved in cell wall biosynthesis
MASPTQKKVVHVICKFARECWGGAETAILNLCQLLPDKGYSCEVWTPDVFSKRGADILDGVKVRRFGSFHLTAQERAMAGTWKAAISPSLLWALLRARGIDLLHLHVHNRLSSLAAVSSMLRRLPFVLSVHSPFEKLEPRWRFFFANEFAAVKAARVVTVSRELRDKMRALYPHLPPDKFIHIPNGVDVQKFEKGNGQRFRSRHGFEREPIILCVGRICEQKNQPLLVTMFPAVLRRCPSARLVIIGPPAQAQYHEDLRAQIRASSCASSIHLMGALDAESLELADAYAAADVFVLPSKIEPFGVVILESWAVGTPVVATRIPGVSEVVQDNVNGVLVDEACLARDLPQVVVDLLSNPERRAQLGEAGRQTVARDYSMPQISNRIADLYDSIVGSRPRSARWGETAHHQDA